MFTLVVLRLVIGWHFFKEGLSHRTDPNWTSEGFLKQAKGPLADHYQAILPTFHQWDELILAPLPEQPVAKEVVADEPAPNKEAKDADAAEKPAKPAAIYDAWLAEVGKDWKAEQDSFASFYRLDENQKKQAAEILKQSTKQLAEVMKEHATDIRLYRELVARALGMTITPGGGEIPFMKERAANVRKDPLKEVGLSGTSAVISAPPAQWQVEAKGVETLYHDRLADLLTADQRKLGEQPADTAELHKIDTGITWMLIAVGGCLIVGLFTRLAALVGSLFLLSVICTQPPWIADTIPTYNQVVEMVAMWVLATTAVGRWGGLDYFIHLLVRACCSGKGKSA